MGINGVSSYANTYTYGNVKNENALRKLAGGMNGNRKAH